MDSELNTQHTPQKCIDDINVAERVKYYRSGDYIEDEMTKKAINIAIRQCNESIRSINKIP